MHDRLRAKVAERLPDRRPVGQIAPQQPAAQDRPFVAGGKVVVDEELVPLLPEGLDHMAADISRAAGHKNPHGFSWMQGGGNRLSCVCLGHDYRRIGTLLSEYADAPSVTGSYPIRLKKTSAGWSSVGASASGRNRYAIFKYCDLQRFLIS